MPWPPALWTRDAVSSIVSGRFISDDWDRVDRPVTYTVAPAAPSCTAIPRPAPRVAPATRATLSSSDPAIGGRGYAGASADGSPQIDRSRETGPIPRPRSVNFRPELGRGVESGCAGSSPR